MSQVNKDTKLVAIICGMPFSGTTFLSRMITSHPMIESGFECGLLFGESPSDFKNAAPKFHKWMSSLEPPYNWKLSASEMKDVCSADSFGDAYNRIVKHCRLFEGDKQFIIDKTPAYVYRLSSIMEKMPDVPVIIIQKELKFQYHSYKKRGISFDEFSDRWLKAEKSIQRALRKKENRQRILKVDFNTISHYRGKSFRKIINHIHKFNDHIEFKKEYVPLLNQTLDKDIKSREKKLRPIFDYDKELLKLRELISPKEEEQLVVLEQQIKIS